MAKPATLDGYSDQYTLDCERVLVTPLRGLGPWKDSVYLVVARPPAVPAHAGTLDVDIVIDLQILADTEAYHTLEDNLKMGFERAENEAGKNSPGVGKPAPNTVRLWCWSCSQMRLKSRAARCSRCRPRARSRH